MTHAVVGAALRKDEILPLRHLRRVEMLQRNAAVQKGDAHLPRPALLRRSGRGEGEQEREDQRKNKDLFSFHA